MSLKNKYRTSSSLVKEGVWFDVTTNSDGSKARVRLRRYGRGNPHWVKAFREQTSTRDMDNLTPDEDEALTGEIFAEACVADWENMQPEDDGVNLDYSIENAKALLMDPEWVELLKDWQAKANNLSAFQDKTRAKEAGN